MAFIGVFISGWYIKGVLVALATLGSVVSSIVLGLLWMLYCLTLPFQMVDAFEWWTASIVALISFTVFGIEEIGIEIENPFGHDPNDLPLVDIC